jgi:3-oxoacyl-[acyl-carrier protein] reductase
MSKKVVIITGAGRGIGRAAAIELARREYATVLVSRTEGELRETAKLAGGDACVLSADIAKPQASIEAAKKCLEKFGRIDAVVHCAGVAPVLKIDQTSDEQWRQIIDTNLSAAFYLARAAWPTFVKQKAGVVVNISSTASRSPFPGFSAYGAAKAGINLFGLALAQEGFPLGIRVHSISPGATETKMFREIFTEEKYPAAKVMDPAEVARVVALCVTGELANTTGEVIWLHKTI